MGIFEFTQCKKLDVQSSSEAFEPCDVAGGTRCQACDELCTLHEDILRKRATLDQLFLQQRELYARINMSHNHILQRFPAQVLSHIYFLSLSEESIPFSRRNPDEECGILTTPFTLGAVCRAWREIIWSSPKMWTRITIILQASPDILEIAQQWLMRSGELPLSIRVFSSLNSECYWGFGIFQLKFSALIQNYISRCWNLEFQCHEQFIPSFSAHCPKLERFKLRSQSKVNPLDSKISLRSLRPEGIHLSVVGCHLSCLEIDWGSITKFEGRIHPKDVYEIFRSAPQLLTCNLTGFPQYYSMANHAGEAFESITVTQKSVTTLSLKPTLDGKRPTAILLRMVSIPTLLHLEVNDFKPWYLIRFIRRSLCNLISLKMQDIDCKHSKELITTFRAMPTLEELHITVDNPCVYQFFIHLSNTCLGANNNGEVFLPNLCVLSIRFSVDTGFLWSHVVSILGSDSELSNPSKRPIKQLYVLYDWTIKGTDQGDDELEGLVTESNLPSYYLEEDVTRGFLMIAASGVDLLVYDIHRGCDLVEVAMETHGIPIPPWYKSNASGVEIKSKFGVMKAINALESRFDSDSDGESSTSNWNDESEPGDTSESDDDNEGSDISDGSYDDTLGLPSHVTGETLELLSDTNFAVSEP